jgi:PKD repeat protein
LSNLTGTSQTFIVRINNTSAAIRSYDTRLVIALNDIGYNTLQTLIVNGTSVPKSTFKYGTPKPYNLWTWPSGDVYPTWFNDTRINIGIIPRKGSVDLIVSVTFSNTSGIRMHFDVYGSKVPPPPTQPGDITHNSLSEDSTCLLQQGPPPPQPPVAKFTYDPLYPQTYEVVTFNASESYDPDGYIVNYTWDFGDGNITTVTEPLINHTYTAFGNYTVKLTVTDNDNLTDEETATIHVSQHPVASFTFSPPDPLEHELVTFNASTSTPDGGYIVNYTWDFGDGNITTVSDPIITHVYDSFGNYTVILNVTDSENKWDTETKVITVEALPIADFWWSPFRPQRYENVTFDASTSTPDGGVIISYAWDFGDGTPIVVENDSITTHYYTEIGNYTVTLNVTDSEGRWDIESKIITVVPRRYFLEVRTEPADIVTIPGEGWYEEGEYVNLTAPTYVSVNDTFRYRFDYWDVDGTSQGVGVNNITVYMDANHTATAHYIAQHCITFDQSGLDTTATGTVVTVNGSAKTMAELPFNMWVDEGDTITYNYAATVSSTTSGKRFALINVTGPTSPFTVTASTTITGNYKVQYQITFDQTGINTDYAGTVVTIDEVNYTVGELPVSFWWDEGSTHNFAFASPLIVNSGKRYIWISTTGLSTLQSDTLTITSSGSVTGNYKTQYLLTVRTTGLGTYVTNVYNGTNVLGTATDATPYEEWFDEGTLLLLDIDTPIMISSNERLIFAYWSGDISGTNRPASVTMNSTKDITANYQRQFKICFDQTGVNTDYTGTIIIIDGNNYGVTDLPLCFWWNEGSTHNFTFQSPLTVTPNAKRYVWTSTSGLSSQQSDSITILTAGNITGNYKIQFYFEVSSDYGSPTPTSGWFDNGTQITASVDSPVPGPPGTQYVCTGWNGTGSVPDSGSTNSVTFTITQPSSITWNWKTQYYLTVQTNPSGLSPAPTPTSGWFDEGEVVTITASNESYLNTDRYLFEYWDIDGVSQGTGVNPITVQMDQPHTATAHYVKVEPLSVQISPESITITLGSSVTFTSTVTGGISPYSYQWYLDEAPVPGANSEIWTFYPNATGTYYVYLNVTDDTGTTAKSNVAQVTVVPPPPPVGGFIIPTVKANFQLLQILYVTIVLVLTSLFTWIKRKTK